MKCIFLHRLLLLLVICFSFGSAFSDVYADPREGFAVVWGDSSKKDAALACLQECVSDSSLLSVTKHLIGHDHVLDVSEVVGKLPASFLFINSTPEIVCFLKFLRGLYNVSNDGTNGHPKGALCILESTTVDFSHKSTALIEMQKIFEDGARCSFVAGSRVILEKISQLRMYVELIQKRETSIKSAQTFHRQLTASKVSTGLINSLRKRIPKEIELYTQAGLNVADLEIMTDSSAKIEQLKTNLTTLADAVFAIISTAPPFPDISGFIREIRDLITKLFFEEETSAVLNKNIGEFFTEFTLKYLHNFYALIRDVEKIENDTSKLSKGNVGISFEKSFSAVDFCKFIFASLGKNLGLAPPEKTTKIILSLRGGLHKPPLTSEPEITVLTVKYGVFSTYLATFFPSAH